MSNKFSPPPEPSCLPPKILDFVQQCLQPQGITHIQADILRQCWAGETYHTIASTNGYDDNYIRAVGAQLWQALSAALGQKVTKHNFRVILEQQLSHQAERSYRSDQDPPLELPRGPVPIDSCFYIGRSPAESNGRASIRQPGALVRIKAPQQYGKTSLMVRLINDAPADYRTVILNLKLASADILKDIQKFLQWFCTTVARSLNLSNHLDDFWDDVCGSAYNCTEYFIRYLLPELRQPLVLALDNVDVLFSYPNIAADFFSVLRAWYESARYGNVESQVWQKLKVVVVYSTDIYIPLNIHQSPFNVGTLIKLPEFTAEQVLTLARCYQLDWNFQQANALIYLVGGHPYLVRLTLYQMYQSRLELGEIIKSAIAPNSIYTDYLEKLLWSVQSHPPLLLALQELMTTEEPFKLDPSITLRLEGMGIIRMAQGLVKPSCALYNLYFKQLLTH